MQVSVSLLKDETKEICMEIRNEFCTLLRKWGVRSVRIRTKVCGIAHFFNTP